MQLLMILIVLVFSGGLILFASPIIFYLAPLVVIGFLISFLTGYARHHSNSIGH
jgi:cytochrome c biogenesis protein CcdA